MKKILKKVAVCILCCALVVLSSISLSACKNEEPKAHTHAYENVNYTITNDKSEAFLNKECECGKTKTTKINNAIIVNPDNAQAIFDGYWNETAYDINNKTVVFDEGEYSHLLLRASKNAIDGVYAHNTATPNALGEKLDTLPTSTDYGSYHYVRSFNNIVFAGTEKAEFNGLFVVWSEHNEAKFPSTIGLENSASIAWYDAVRETYCNTNSNTKIANYQHLSLNNILFENMNFSGKYGRIEIRNNTTNDGVKNLTVNNCEFKTDEAYEGFQDWFWEGVAISLKNALTESEVKVVQNYENIVVKNNIIKGHYQGVYVQNGKNVEVSGNTILNTVHNFIAIQSVENVNSIDKTSTKYFTGNIVIKNNIMANSGDRAIRFGNGLNANIVIENNNILTDGVDSSDEVLKTSALEGCVFTFKNNNYQDKRLLNIIEETQNKYVIKITDE